MTSSARRPPDLSAYMTINHSTLQRTYSSLKNSFETAHITIHSRYQTAMSIDFVPVPFPDLPIYDYFERRFSRSSSGTTAPSPLAASPFDEKVMQARLLEFVESQRADHEDISVQDADEIDGLLESQSPLIPS